MKAMVLHQPGSPLQLSELPIPEVGDHQVLLKIRACGVCRTDLHITDGELDKPKLPLIPGHEIVGDVVDCGKGVERYTVGQRLGVPWLGHTCGHCRYCQSGRENLCDQPGFTGYTLNGGYAEYAVADEDYCFPLPDQYADADAAPLLCAGLIGYRALAAAGDARILGIYGFGAAAHIIAQVARWQGRTLFAFTRPGDQAGQGFALALGAHWAGDSSQAPPQPMDAAILFAPVGTLVPQALQHTVKGGTVVCAGIHMSDIPTFPYALLWGERTLCSVANLTRGDAEGFLAIAGQTRITTHVKTFSLADANLALQQLKQGQIQGAAVLKIA